MAKRLASALPVADAVSFELDGINCKGVRMPTNIFIVSRLVR